MSEIIFLGTGSGASKIDKGTAERAFANAFGERESFAMSNGVGLADAGNAMSGIRDEAILRRGDSCGGGLAAPQDLTARKRLILERKYCPTNLINVLPRRNLTPPGFKYAEIGYTDWTGEASLYECGINIPSVEVSAVWERVPVATYVIGFKQCILDQRGSNNMLNQFDLKAGAAINALWRKANQVALRGESRTGLPGLLSSGNVPQLIDDTAWSTADAQTIYDKMAGFLNYSQDISCDISMPNQVYIASKLYRLLTQKRFGDCSGDTVMMALMANYPGITLTPMSELNDAGPNGEHGIYMWDGGDPDSLFLDIVDAPQFIAPQAREFEELHFAFMTIGGVHAFNAYSNLLVWVPAS